MALFDERNNLAIALVDGILAAKPLPTEIVSPQVFPPSSLRFTTTPFQTASSVRHSNYNVREAVAL